MNRFAFASLASALLASTAAITGCSSHGGGDLATSGGRVAGGTDASTYADEPVAETATDPSAATPSTPSTTTPSTDAGRPPVGDGGVLADGGPVSSGGDAATNALPTACKDLGHCCAQVIACDGETLACMRVVMADDAQTCLSTLNQYKTISCTHSAWESSPSFPSYTGFQGCPNPGWGGGGS